jgi:hypothetical protein
MSSSLNLTTKVIYIILSLVLSPLPLPPHTEQKGGANFSAVQPNSSRTKAQDWIHREEDFKFEVENVKNERIFTIRICQKSSFLNSYLL